MMAEEKKAADNLKQETLEEDEQQDYLTEQIKKKSIYDFLRNDSLPR